MYFIYHIKTIKEENQGNIKKTREAVIPSLETVKLYALKYYVEKSQ